MFHNSRNSNMATTHTRLRAHHAPVQDRYICAAASCCLRGARACLFTFSTAASVAAGAAREGDTLEDLLPTIVELEEIYLTPRKKFAEDVRLSLGGGTGPNPFGFAHVNGATPPELIQEPKKTKTKKKRRKISKKDSKKAAKKEKQKKAVVFYANR